MSNNLSGNFCLRLMGEHSLEIYMIHMFISAGSRFLIAKLLVEAAIVYLIIILAMAIIIPIGIGHLSKIIMGV